MLEIVGAYGRQDELPQPAQQSVLIEVRHLLEQVLELANRTGVGNAAADRVQPLRERRDNSSRHRRPLAERPLDVGLAEREADLPLSMLAPLVRDTFAAVWD